MSLLPIFVKMTGRPALVVGGKALARPKIQALLEGEAAVTVIAPSVVADIEDWQQQGRIVWLRRNFEAADVGRKALVFAATGQREIDRRVYAVCQESGVWCNAIDDPEYCDFYSPAIVRRGDLQIAVSTNGQSPALAQKIRQELEVRFDARWREKTAELGRRRREVLATMPSGPERTAILHAQAREAMHGQGRGFAGRMGAAIWKWLNTEDDKVALI